MTSARFRYFKHFWINIDRLSAFLKCFGASKIDKAQNQVVYWCSLLKLNLESPKSLQISIKWQIWRFFTICSSNLLLIFWWGEIKAWKVLEYPNYLKNSKIIPEPECMIIEVSLLNWTCTSRICWGISIIMRSDFWDLVLFLLCICNW